MHIFFIRRCNICAQRAEVSGPNKKVSPGPSSPTPRVKQTPHSGATSYTPRDSGPRTYPSPVISSVSPLTTSYLHLMGTDHQFCSRPRLHENASPSEGLAVSVNASAELVLSKPYCPHLISSSAHLHVPLTSISNQPQTISSSESDRGPTHQPPN
jgi:hypothetical protein